MNAVKEAYKDFWYTGQVRHGSRVDVVGAAVHERFGGARVAFLNSEFRWVEDAGNPIAPSYDAELNFAAVRAFSRFRRQLQRLGLRSPSDHFPHTHAEFKGESKLFLYPSTGSQWKVPRFALNKNALADGAGIV